MQKNLLILVHPHFEKSVANRMLIENLENMHFSNLTIKNLYAAYPNRNIDLAKEQADLKAHDRIIFQFPLYWYSSPSLLKDWKIKFSSCRIEKNHPKSSTKRINFSFLF